MPVAFHPSTTRAMGLTQGGTTMIHRISCSETLLRLDDYVDRALSPADLELVEEHLLECVKCAAKFRFEASMLDAIRDRLSRISAPEGLLRSIRERLGTEAG
jgi:anti-sigma factor RsiW